MNNRDLILLNKYILNDYFINTLLDKSQGYILGILELYVSILMKLVYISTILKSYQINQKGLVTEVGTEINCVDVHFSTLPLSTR